MITPKIFLTHKAAFILAVRLEIKFPFHFTGHVATHNTWLHETPKGIAGTANITKYSALFI